MASINRNVSLVHLPSVRPKLCGNSPAILCDGSIDCSECCNKIAFESQRLEIAALHTAEERAAQRTSRIRLELGCSEQELSALEREMNEIGKNAFPAQTFKNENISSDPWRARCFAGLGALLNSGHYRVVFR